MLPHLAMCPLPIPNREMKLTSPRLNLVIALGAIVWYISSVVKTIPTEDLTTATVLCEVRCHAEITIAITTTWSCNVWLCNCVVFSCHGGSVVATLPP